MYTELSLFLRLGSDFKQPRANNNDVVGLHRECVPGDPVMLFITLGMSLCGFFDEHLTNYTLTVVFISVTLYLLSSYVTSMSHLTFRIGDIH